MQAKPHPGGRPKGAKTNHSKRDLQDLRDILHSIRDRKVDLSWAQSMPEQLARATMYQDSQDLRSVVPALTPILTANIEMIDTRSSSLDLTELIKAAAATPIETPALPPAPSAGSQLGVAPLRVLQLDDE